MLRFSFWRRRQQKRDSTVTNRTCVELAVVFANGSDLQRTLADIDASFARSPHLAERLHKQATAEIPSAAHETFTKFQSFCADWGLPCLPEATPQGLALFITQEAKDSPHARRLLNNITAVYKKLNPPAYEDTLVKVIVDAFRDNSSPQTH